MKTAERTDEIWSSFGLRCECASARCGHWEALYVSVRALVAEARREALEEAALEADGGSRRGPHSLAARVMAERIARAIRALAAKEPDRG